MNRPTVDAFCELLAILGYGENRRTKFPPHEVLRESTTAGGNVARAGGVELGDSIAGAGRGYGVDGPVNESASLSDLSDGGDGDASGAEKLAHMNR